MIVSHTQKYIFTAIPKTASQSIRLSLRGSLDANDWEQCLLYDKKKFPVKALAAIGHGHIFLKQLKPYLLPQMWQNYFKFAVVRHPLGRLISYACFQNKHQSSMAEMPLQTLKTILNDKREMQHLLLKPQYEFVCDDQGKVLVDYIGYFESLVDDFSEIKKHIGNAELISPLIVLNQSHRLNRSIELDSELEDLLVMHYQKDFELFNYKLGFKRFSDGLIE